VQDGSSPITGVPARISSRSASRVRVSTFFAMSTWPVEIHVSPQHRSCSGTTMVQPAASNTWTAAWPTAGWKLLVKVSGHRMTRGPSPAGAAGRRANQWVNRSRANTGTVRSCAAPASHLPACASPGAAASALTAPGATAATRAHTGSQPIA